MKLITSIQGTAAIKYSVDEAAPLPAVLTRDVIASVGELYDFSVRPDVPPGLLLNPAFVFQSGAFVGDKKTPINQLVLTLQSGGIILTSRDSDTAETILNHLIATLDEKFGFKISSSIRGRYYQSNVVIEFDHDFERALGQIGRIRQLLEREIKRSADHPFAAKRFAFGSMTIDQLVQAGLAAVEDIQNVDFSIERRAGEPLSSNRYFSVSPTTTNMHLRILELIEHILRG